MNAVKLRMHVNRNEIVDWTIMAIVAGALFFSLFLSIRHHLA